MVKIIIADDELIIRRMLKKIIKNIPEVILVGEAETGIQLIEMTEDKRPDVIFIDIKMPELSGLDAAKYILTKYPQTFIVFVTGLNQYVYEAFKLYAVDYIMKPFDEERIINTINRIKSIKFYPKVDSSKQQYAKINKNKLRIKNRERSHIIDIEDIIFITRLERKTFIYTRNGIIKTHKTLHRIEALLKHQKLYRCHKSYIINTDMIIEILPWGRKTYSVKLKNTEEIVLMTIEKAKIFQKKYCFE